MNCYDKLTKKQNPPLNVCQLNNVRHKNDDLLRFTNHGNAKSRGSGYDFGSIYLRVLYATCWKKVNTHAEHTKQASVGHCADGGQSYAMCPLYPDERQ